MAMTLLELLLKDNYPPINGWSSVLGTMYGTIVTHHDFGRVYIFARRIHHATQPTS